MASIPSFEQFYANSGFKKDYSKKTGTTSGNGSSGNSGGGSSRNSGSLGSSGAGTTVTTTTTPAASGTTMAGRNPYEELKSIYDAAAEAQRRARRAAYEEAAKAQKAVYDQNVAKVNDAADKALREAYINKMQSQRTMGQQMAAQGLNGGYSETTAAGLQNNYGNARNELETERGSQLNDLGITYQNNMAALQNILSQGVAGDTSNYYTNLAALIANNPTAMLSMEQNGAENTGTTNYNKLLEELMNQGYTAAQAAKIAASSGGYAGLLQQYFG